MILSFSDNVYAGTLCKECTCTLLKPVVISDFHPWRSSWQCMGFNFCSDPFLHWLLEDAFNLEFSASAFEMMGDISSIFLADILAILHNNKVKAKQTNLFPFPHKPEELNCYYSKILATNRIVLSAWK